MDRFITKSKYFTANFNTAIFSDPIRIYFSSQHESHALELYFRLQKRKNQWDKFLRKDGAGKYCYIMLYSDQENFSKCFDRPNHQYVPTNFGDDYIIGINGPLDTNGLDRFVENFDNEIGFKDL